MTRAARLGLWPLFFLAVQAWSAETAALPEFPLQPGPWIEQARAGQWIRARLTIRLDAERRVEAVVTRSIEAVERDGEARLLRVKSRIEFAGVTETYEERLRVMPPEADAPPASPQADDLKVAGQKLRCAVSESRLEKSGRKEKVKTWTSAALAFGVARVEIDGKPSYEVLEYGPRP
ncbi:MAG: hypothetical protein HS116_00890 [Planctomycetes bacterium]|nr:hypothetical protein [Planctomycetota bacterium]